MAPVIFCCYLFTNLSVSSLPVLIMWVNSIKKLIRDQNISKTYDTQASEKTNQGQDCRIFWKRKSGKFILPVRTIDYL